MQEIWSKASGFKAGTAWLQNPHLAQPAAALWGFTRCLTHRWLPYLFCSRKARWAKGQTGTDWLLLSQATRLPKLCLLSLWCRTSDTEGSFSWSGLPSFLRQEEQKPRDTGTCPRSLSEELGAYPRPPCPASLLMGGALTPPSAPHPGSISAPWAPSRGLSEAHGRQQPGQCKARRKWNQAGRETLNRSHSREVWGEIWNSDLLTLNCELLLSHHTHTFTHILPCSLSASYSPPQSLSPGSWDKVQAQWVWAPEHGGHVCYNLSDASSRWPQMIYCVSEKLYM